jgi:hypothetical protein
MPKYRVEVDGETVWEGKGDTVRDIPAEWSNRPADSPPGEPHPPAHFLYVVERGKETLIGVQISQAEEEGR